MDVGWVARRIDRDPEDTKDWTTVRNADVARRQDAEAAGRHAWEQATRSGQNLSAARLSDVVALGAHVLSQRDAGTTTPKRLSATPVIIGDPAPARPLLSPDTTRQDLAWRSLGFPAVRPSEFDSQAGSAAGPALAQGAGIVAGLFRGARHTGADALRTAFFAARAANPLDGALSAHGKSARDEIGATVGRLANYADNYISHPDHFGRDVRNTVHRVAVDMIPGATPEASTPEAEQLRRFRIGENQGELGFNGLLAIAAPASELGEMALQGSKAANVARFVAHSPTYAKVSLR